MRTEVEAYAGAVYPERPRAFVLGGERMEVVDVEGWERAPRGPRFRVRTDDRRRFWLAYDEVEDVWHVWPKGRPPEEGDASWAF